MSSVAGRVAMAARGVYSSSAQYYKMDVVTKNNATYIAKKNPPLGTDPTNTEYWLKMVDGADSVATLQAEINALDSSKADKSMLTNDFVFKGSTTYASLPTSGNTVNDTYYVTDKKCKYTWSGSAWYVSSIDETDYENELGEVREDIGVIINNNAILDRVCSVTKGYWDIIDGVWVDTPNQAFRDLYVKTNIINVGEKKYFRITKDTIYSENRILVRFSNNTLYNTYDNNTVITIPNGVNSFAVYMEYNGELSALKPISITFENDIDNMYIHATVVSNGVFNGNVDYVNNEIVITELSDGTGFINSNVSSGNDVYILSGKISSNLDTPTKIRIGKISSDYGIYTQDLVVNGGEKEFCVSFEALSIGDSPYPVGITITDGFYVSGAVIKIKNLEIHRKGTDSFEIAKQKILNNGKMIWIGDSFSDKNDSYEWVEDIAKTLNLELHNFATSGSGFYPYNNANNFAKQIDDASLILKPIEREATKYIVVYGGVNDTANLPISDVGSYVTLFKNRVNANFQNSHVIYVINNISNPFHPTHIPNEKANGIDLIKYIADNCEGSLVNAMYFMLPWGQSAWNNDNVHPSDYGKTILKKCILNLFEGSNNFVNNTYGLDISSRTSDRVVLKNPKMRVFTYDLEMDLDMTLVAGNNLRSDTFYKIGDYHYPVFSWERNKIIPCSINENTFDICGYITVDTEGNIILKVNQDIESHDDDITIYAGTHKFNLLEFN